MKKIFWCGILFAGMIFLPQLAYCSDIVSLFNGLPFSEGSLFATKYKLQKENDKYVTKSTRRSAETIYPIVDQENGFIYINDYHGAEDGEFDIACALFIGTDGMQYLGISCWHLEETNYTSDWVFYRISSGKYIDVTKSVLNSYNSKVFIKRNFQGEKYANEVINNKTILLLPRYGTDISIILNDSAVFHYYDEINRPTDFQQWKSIERVLKNLEFNVLAYKWNPKTNKFEEKEFLFVKPCFDFIKHYFLSNKL